MMIMAWVLLLSGVLFNQALDLPTDWGDVEAFGVAEQRHAPVLIVGEGWTVGVWVSADESDTYHTLRRWDRDGLGEEKRLPILTAFPQNHQVVSTQMGLHHLLWLDGEPSEPLAGLRLWGVMVRQVNQSPDITRGAFIVNDYPIFDFDAVTDGEGGAWVFFNSLPLAEPNLYAQHLDREGRPRTPTYLIGGANHPRAVRLEDGTIRIFWHNPLTGKLLSGEFVADQLTNIQTHLTVPTLDKTDLLDDVHIAVDQTHYTIFWNITRFAESRSETFFSTARRDDLTAWTTRQRLMMDDVPLAWASPVQGENIPERLMVGALMGNEIGIISMQDGSVIDYQNVIALGESRLVGSLYLTTTPDGRLTLSWSHLSPTGAVMSVIRQHD